MGKKAGLSSGRDILEGPGVTIAHGSLLDSLFKEVQKDFINLERAADDTVDLWCPSGNAAVDLILSDKLRGGGYPFGRIIEYYGNESSGKSMMAMLACINCIQRLGGAALMLDVENAFVPGFYEKLGGDPRYLWVESPNNIPKTYDTGIKILDKVRKKKADLPMVVVVDSIPAMQSKEEADKALDQRDMASRAREHRKGLARFMGEIKRTPTILIIINQLIATMAMFGPDQDTVGGTGPKYWSSVRMHLKKGKRLYRKASGKIVEFEKGAKNQTVGTRGRMVVEKTRFTAPFREVNFNIFYEGGIHPYSGWFKALLEHAKGKYFTEALTKEGKIRAGYYVPKGAAPTDTSIQFTENTFMDYLANHEELLSVYPYQEGFGLPKDEELEMIDLDEKTGKPIESIPDDNEEIINDPNDASQV